MKRLREAQPQQGQIPQSPKPPGAADVLGKVITVTDPGGRVHRARVGAYMGAENGFELEMDGGDPYPSILSSQLAQRGWQVPQLSVGQDTRRSELARLGATVRRTVESAERIVSRLLD